MTDDDDVITCDASSAGFTVTLPAASTVSGRIFTIKKTDSTFNIVTIDGNGAEPIDGYTTRKLATQNETIKIMSNGSNFIVLERYIPCVVTAFTMQITGTTSNPSKNGSADDLAFWWREGAFMVIDYYYRHGASGSAGSGSYLFALPTGAPLIDTTKINVSTVNFRGFCGSGHIVNNAADYLAYVRPYDTSNLVVTYDQTAATTVVLGSGNVNLAINTNLVYAFRAKVPLENWEG
jgi:hypothetical protein